MAEAGGEYIRAALAAGRLDEAEALLRERLAQRPDDGAAWRDLGMTLQQQGRPEEALDAYRRAAAGMPSAEVIYLLAAALRDGGRADEARPHSARLLAAHPREPAAMLLHGSVLAAAGDCVAAEAVLRRAVAREPGLIDAWHYLGLALHRQQRWREAEDCYRRVLAQRGDDARLQFNLGLCLENRGELDAARAAFVRAVELAPDRAGNWARLANVQALLCDWDGEADAVAALERTLTQPGDPDDIVEPFVLMFLPLSDAARDAVLARYVARIDAEAAASPPPRVGAVRSDGPLRLGYLSPDLGSHAVGGLVRDLFAAHDRSNVLVHAYSLRRYDDAVAQAIRAGCDRFRAVEGQSAAAVAQTIAADGIDVLIDLGGYTLAARPAVLALRPAPVQLGWLGFLHSYGAPWLDYLVLDRALAPDGSQSRFAERLIRLPGTALPGSAQVPVAAMSREAFGLPADRFLFASFNAPYKLDAALLAAWAEILRRSPHADLVLTAPDDAAERLRASWHALGGDVERLRFVPRLPMAQHAARMAACDLMLDAFRYQAGATGMAAAAAGLPLLTMPGRRPTERLGLSLAGHLGLDDELVVDSTRAYVHRAAELAAQPRRLAALRERLRCAVVATGLFDPVRCAAAIEAAALAAQAANRSGNQSQVIDI